jgi:hypothetical protein
MIVRWVGVAGRVVQQRTRQRALREPRQQHTGKREHQQRFSCGVGCGWVSRRMEFCGPEAVCRPVRQPARACPFQFWFPVPARPAGPRRGAAAGLVACGRRLRRPRAEGGGSREASSVESSDWFRRRDLGYKWPRTRDAGRSDFALARNPGRNRTYDDEWQPGGPHRDQ